MSYFTELKCVSRFVIAVPATTKDEERMKLLSIINAAVRDAVIELRQSNVNFLPLEVTTSLENME
jgi:hypothetical protein